MNVRIDWIVSPADAPLRGDVAMPGDKSISHRAIMLAAIAEGTSRISGFLEAADTHSTVAIFRQLGVSFEDAGEGEKLVHGVGLRGLQASAAALDCGNSGTAMRLLAGLLAGQVFDSVLTGDVSLSRRPMRRVMAPLAKMGARIESDADGVPPLRIRGGTEMHGIDYRPPVASAQVKSAILLAGLYAAGETRVVELRPTRDYTERMLAAFGWPVEFETGRVRLAGGHALRAADVVVPADFSAAAFFIVAATLIRGSELRLREVGLNSRRTGLLQALRMMGADIAEEDPRESGGERIADLVVRHAPLRGIVVPEAVVPDMIDEFPVLFAAAAAAQGTTVIRGAQELRIKESDRIAVMATGLRALGIGIEETPDGAVIEGGRLHGGEVDTRGDHRCAMAFAVAGACADGEVLIRDCANVGTSFPRFPETAGACGMTIRAGHARSG